MILFEYDIRWVLGFRLVSNWLNSINGNSSSYVIVDDDLMDMLIIDCYSWHREVILQILLSFKFNLSISKFKLPYIRCGITAIDI